MRGRRLTGARTCGGRRALPAAQIQRGEARGGGRGGRKEGAVRGRGGGWEPRRRGGHGIGAAVCVHTCPPVSRPSAVCECRLPVAPGGSHVHTSRSHVHTSRARAATTTYQCSLLRSSAGRSALPVQQPVYTHKQNMPTPARAHAAPHADPRATYETPQYVPTAPMHWRKSVPTVPRVLSFSQSPVRRTLDGPQSRGL